jgi:hypothetical protein
MEITVRPVSGLLVLYSTSCVGTRTSLPNATCHRNTALATGWPWVHRKPFVTAEQFSLCDGVLCLCRPSLLWHADIVLNRPTGSQHLSYQENAMLNGSDTSNSNATL